MEFTAITLNCIDGQKIIVVSFYRRHALIVSELDALLNCCKNITPKVVIAGDFNAHNPFWGCAHSNSEGNKLLRWIQDSSFSIHRSRFPSGKDAHSQSILDMFLTSSAIQMPNDHLLQSYPFDSDHDVVEMFLKIKKIAYQQQRNYLDWKEANFEAINYSEIMVFLNNKQTLMCRMSISEIDDAVEELPVVIGNAICRHVPSRKMSKGMLLPNDDITKKCLGTRRNLRKSLFKVQRRIYAGTANANDASLLISFSFHNCLF